MKEARVPSRLLLDFNKADAITTMMEPPRPVLVVTGVKPYAAMDVTLVPLAYEKVPAFWEIQVVGTAGNLNVPTQLPADTTTPYSVELDLAGLIGLAGVEVIGADHKERIAMKTSETD
jgi:hypothetical protein